MTMRWLVQGLLVTLLWSVPATAQQASDLYQGGLVQEHATGHLEDAIALYTEAARAAGTDRALAARALVRAAGCYEKLGERKDAAKLYADVMRAYPEQRAEVSVAQERVRVLRRQAAASVSSSTAPVIERYCLRCHSPANKSGGLDLASLNEHPVAENTGAWERVVRRMLARRDPPVGSPRPDEDTYRSVTATLQGALDDAYAANGSLKDAERADDIELALRLATLIWNDVPDASLLVDAKSGRLHEPASVQRHVARMLRDPRSANLVSGFFATWLSLDRVKKASPDPALFPQIDADLLQAMDTETRLFLASQLRDDRDAVEIWTADYTYVNARLARHYGLSGVTDSAFRRVVWPDDRRAGLLGQASILLVLSQPSRTSPTARGRFVLSRFLGVEAPNPPANVPTLVERPASIGTMRERLMAHKVNPSCASCHALFDPMGLALENFDATGGWRTTDGGLPIDTSGTFIDGRHFEGPAGLRSAMLKHRDAYYTSVTQQLLSYALNRKGKAGQVYDYEMAAVRKIVRNAAVSGYRWSSILAGIATSEPFQMKHVVP
jgi:hypothetical protein